MSRVVYFVVGVDLDAKEPYIDDDVFTARFDTNERLWDDEAGEWREEDFDSEYLLALEILNTVPLAKE